MSSLQWNVCNTWQCLLVNVVLTLDGFNIVLTLNSFNIIVLTFINTKT